MPAAERGRLVERIDAAVAAMNELFNALLDISKLDAGVLAPDITDFPIAHLLEQNRERLLPRPRAKRDCRCGVVPSSAWVRSDLILLERILLNLVSNAVRYTPQGGVVVGCRRRGGSCASKSGIAGPAFRRISSASIFGEFYQFAGPERDGARLGLGLAIVDRLCRLLDHPIELDFDLGQGFALSPSSCLWSLPSRKSPRRRVRRRRSRSSRGKLIVVVDDDTLVLEGMGGLLRSWGCRVVAAGSHRRGIGRARRARSTARSHHFRLSSCRTEDRHRCDRAAARRVRAPIPAFLISGDTAPDDCAKRAPSGYHLLHKPVSPMRCAPC